MSVNALDALRRHAPWQARVAPAESMTERPASVDTRRPARARLERASPPLGDPGAARRAAAPSRPAPSRASARPRPPARGLLRAALVGALALVMLLCVLAPAAQALQDSTPNVLDDSDWSVVATRGGVKITIDIRGERDSGLGACRI